jgi:hypothetical protein
VLNTTLEALDMETHANDQNKRNFDPFETFSVD